MLNEGTTFLREEIRARSRISRDFLGRKSEYESARGRGAPCNDAPCEKSNSPRGAREGEESSGDLLRGG